MKLLTYPSKEVRKLSRMVLGDPRSITCRNLIYLREKVEHYSAWRVKDALPVKKVPEKELAEYLDGHPVREVHDGPGQ